MIEYPDLFLWQVIFATVVTIFAGFTKGVTGFALPMIMISGMTIVMDANLAIASIVVPTMVGNLWQALQHGLAAARTTMRKHWLLLVTTLLMIAVHAQWVGALNLNILLALLGTVIVSISLVQILGVRINVPPNRERLGAFITGHVAGFFGAVSATWGPPTMLYLLAVNTPKAEQVRVAGIAFGLGAVVFAIAHQRSGLVTGQALGLSIMMLPPMIVGLYIGARAQPYIDQAMFRRVTLWVLVIAGLNILRKAVLG